jgi:hypothetical protein
MLHIHLWTLWHPFVDVESFTLLSQPAARNLNPLKGSRRCFGSREAGTQIHLRIPRGKFVPVLAPFSLNAAELNWTPLKVNRCKEREIVRFQRGLLVYESAPRTAVLRARSRLPPLVKRDLRRTAFDGLLYCSDLIAGVLTCLQSAEDF